MNIYHSVYCKPPLNYTKNVNSYSQPLLTLTA